MGWACFLLLLGLCVDVGAQRLDELRPAYHFHPAKNWMNGMFCTIYFVYFHYFIITVQRFANFEFLYVFGSTTSSERQIPTVRTSSIFSKEIYTLPAHELSNYDFILGELNIVFKVIYIHYNTLAMPKKKSLFLHCKAVS
jgi:hypothetical protein